MKCTIRHLYLLGLAVMLIASACGPAAPAATPTPAPPPQEMILATTTSTADSGLLEAILPVFE